jgi:putative methionine-R-sulfoxide reductase with GAF domain
MPDPFATIRKVIAGGLSRTAKARALAGIIQEARGFHWVGLYDVTAEEIRAIAWTGLVAPAFPVFPRSRGLNGAAVASRERVVAQDGAKDARWLTTFGTTRAEAVFPVSVSGTVGGTMDVESERVGAFRPADEAFLAAVAEVIRPLWADAPVFRATPDAL